MIHLHTIRRIPTSRSEKRSAPWASNDFSISTAERCRWRRLLTDTRRIWVLLLYSREWHALKMRRLHAHVAGHLTNLREKLQSCSISRVRNERCLLERLVILLWSKVRQRWRFYWFSIIYSFYSMLNFWNIIPMRNITYIFLQSSCKLFANV